MKIGLAQLMVRAGNPEENLLKMTEMIKQAKAQQTDIIVFPEMCISGYAISDWHTKQAFIDEIIQMNESLVKLSDGIGIVWGNYYQRDDFRQRDGRKARFNAAYFAFNGKIMERDGLGDIPYLKTCLPDYRFFDDSRYFTSSADLALNQGKQEDFYIKPFEFEKDGKKIRIGLEVCEDLWSDDYRINPTKLYSEQAVDLIINISASPWTLNKEKSRAKQIQRHATALGEAMPKLIYLNASGIQNNGKNVLLFDGGSVVYQSDGSVSASCNDVFEEELKIIDLKQTNLSKACDHKLLEGLIKGIRYFDQQLLGGRLNWVIGLSGGLDSSVNAALAVLALGKDRVIGYNMASRFNQLKSISMAKTSAELLGIRYAEGSIEQLVEATQGALTAFGYELKDEGLAFENAQARIRGHLLSSFASLESAVIMNNGNKVECALGYATLYGDTIGALSPLGDVTKVQIFDLAKAINERFGKNVISPALIPNFDGERYHFEFAPSAELKNNQLDPMKWGYHDFLVQFVNEYPGRSMHDILKAYRDKEWENWPIAALMRQYGLDKPETFVEDLRWFMRAYQSAIFKRIQFPPIIAVSRASFGFDYRESQLPYRETPEIKKLIGQILESA